MTQVKITELVLRDGHQSLIATRMRTEDMLPICSKLDNAGYWSLEAWGGATFDACVRFLKEDPWERLRKLRRALPNSRIQMLLRGQNLLGYRHYSDDVVRAFVGKSANNGVDVFRIFDAMNDLHSHSTSGLSSMCFLKGVEAGATMLDTCNSSFGEGASHSSTESIVAALQGTKYDTGLDLAKLQEVTAYFYEVRQKYWQYECAFTGVDTRVLVNHVPGGMISNLSNQLKESGALNRMNEVLAEIPRVREDLGYPPLVTPTSQIVGTQAVMNILTGTRYKSVTNEVKNYLLGHYGKAPGKVNEQVKKLAVRDVEGVACRPADLIEDEMNKLKIESETFAQSEEDVLTYAMFPDLAKTFLQERNADTLKPEPLLSKEAATTSSERYAPNEFKATLHGETFHIKLTGSAHHSEAQRPVYVSVDGISEEVIVETLNEIEVSGEKSNGKKKTAPSASGAGRPRPSHEGCLVTAMPGTIVDVKVRTGDKVKAGDGVLVIEAMKMENEIQAPISGVVVGIHVKK